jgi:4-diphosphocytidyl-2-C-methyl-D-erythritol kinase
MLVFPNCKLNLGLRILNKREDGFHNLETVFYPLAINDALEIISSSGSDLEFSQTGLTVDVNESDNICIKACHLLTKDFPKLPGLKMHLHKTIPMGAGLGGGSADGAFTLQLLNTKFQLHLTQQQLINYALQLGSDCPFFIINQPCFATGRGEILEPVALDLSKYKIAIVNPGIHVNTGWAFTALANSIKENQTIQQPSLKQIITQPISEWKDHLKNDFELPVFAAHPTIEKIKTELYNMGALYAAMSGSGSTVFGIFEQVVSLNSFLQQGYFARLV